MTNSRTTKRRVRARMAETGENYTRALRAIQARRTCTCAQLDVSALTDDGVKPLPRRGITDPDCPTHGQESP